MCQLPLQMLLMGIPACHMLQVSDVFQLISSFQDYKAGATGTSISRWENLRHREVPSINTQEGVEPANGSTMQLGHSSPNGALL
jgi:hypothetical protein